jgi:uncharacterized protein
MQPTGSPIDFVRLLGIIGSQFQLDEHTDHGPDHWKKVEQNGLILAASSGADVVVVRLFALFHDSKRENEFTYPEHGRRGAAYARKLHGIHFQITEAQLELLEFACTWHTDTTHHPDPTIGTCWDADRLDLGRVGIIPNARYMNTDQGRELAGELGSQRGC